VNLSLLKNIYVKKAKNGNKRAFQKLIEQEKEMLYKIAYLYTKDENDALDIFQETLIKALTSIHSLKDEDYFSTWITRILINNAKNYLSKKNRLIPMETGLLEQQVSNPMLNIDNKIDLFDAFNYLEEKEKSVVILRFYKDYTIQQIANVLDIPEGSVKSTIHRSLKKMRGNLKGGIVSG
jgi:RNA polymerase sigma-70 factor (ECF subfamily)